MSLWVKPLTGFLSLALTSQRVSVTILLLFRNYATSMSAELLKYKSQSLINEKYTPTHSHSKLSVKLSSPWYTLFSDNYADFTKCLHCHDFMTYLEQMVGYLEQIHYNNLYNHSCEGRNGKRKNIIYFLFCLVFYRTWACVLTPVCRAPLTWAHH